jgi:hypothetical protein
MTETESIGAIFAVVKTAWGVDYDIVWPNLGTDSPPDDSTPAPAPYARVRFEHRPGHSSIGRGSGGTKRYHRNGYLTVEIRVPGGTQGYNPIHTLGRTVRGALESSPWPDSLWLRGEVRMQGPVAAGKNLLLAIRADFSWEDVH